jgi:hypothetical protein
VASRPLPNAAVAFRTRLLDTLDTPIERFFYIDENTCVCVCPLCDGALTVRFAGTAPRADLTCQRGCAEREVVYAALGRKARR